jgi:hypothetical protein
MKSSKKFNPGVVRQFFVLHSEKLVLAVFALGACYVANLGLAYKPLEWQPNELVQAANRAKQTIEASQQSAADAGISIFPYDTFADQIKTRVQSSPYQTKITWMPSLIPSPEKRRQVKFLAATEVKVETDRGTPAGRLDAIWTEITATIPEFEQAKIFEDAYNNAVKVEPATRNIPKYYAYDFERAEVIPGKPLQWKPLSEYPELLDGNTARGGGYSSRYGTGTNVQPHATIIQNTDEGTRAIKYTDYDVEPGKTYVYRIKYILENPNFQLPVEYVEDGVSTTEEYLDSEWSNVSAPIFVPGLTRIRVAAVTPPDRGAWTQLRTPWNAPSGKVELVRFDMDTGLDDIPLEMPNVISRGSVCNIKRPDDPYISDACVLDMFGGRTITKGRSKEAISTPDLQVPAKMLVLHPNGNLTVESYEDPELAKLRRNSQGRGRGGSGSSYYGGDDH